MATTPILATIQFTASVSGGVEPYTAEWTSDIDGALGTGEQLQHYLTSGFHTIQLHVVDAEGTVIDLTVQIDVEAEVVDAGEDQAVAFELKPNYPNPFNPSTTIRYSLPELGHARVAVYNLQGALVAVLVDEMTEVGNHSVTFDAGNLAAGLYFCVFDANRQRDIRKMTLLK